jgi:SnoaL-like protein
MSAQDNIQMIRKVYDAWNAHDPKRVAALFDETFVAESDTLPAPLRGTEGVRKFVEMYAVAASSAIPGFFEPYMIDGRDYVDGCIGFSGRSRRGSRRRDSDRHQPTVPGGLEAGMQSIRARGLCMIMEQSSRILVSYILNRVRVGRAEGCGQPRQA